MKKLFFSQIRRVLISLTALTAGLGVQSANAANYDVFLLIGQSNMSGRGSGPDESGYAATNARIAQWNHERHRIELADDPLSQQDFSGGNVKVGLGRSFAKSYALRIPADRKVLIVGAAFGGTGFDPTQPNNWTVPNGNLPRNAVSRINAAMAAAGQGAVFKGILWHQGESDSGPGGAERYPANMNRLMNYLKANIRGANASTPWVVGEVAPQWLEKVDPTRTGSASKLQRVNHSTPDRERFTAWVASDGLRSNSVPDIVHMSALSQRELGRRYSDKFFEAANNMPQPHIHVKAYGASFYNIGRTVDNQKKLKIKGAVGISRDARHGNVASIRHSAGSLEVTVAPNFMGGSYTKSVWVKLASYGLRNHLISGQKTGQDHYLYFPSGGKFVAAGHGNTQQVNVYVKSPTAVPLNTWTMVTVTYDAPLRLMKLYQNGALVAQRNNTPPAPWATGSSVFQFGAFGSHADFGVDGNMADQRVYKNALSGAQVAALFRFENGQRAGF